MGRARTRTRITIGHPCRAITKYLGGSLRHLSGADVCAVVRFSMQGPYSVRSDGAVMDSRGRRRRASHNGAARGCRSGAHHGRGRVGTGSDNCHDRHHQKLFQESSSTLGPLPPDVLTNENAAPAVSGGGPHHGAETLVDERAAVYTMALGRRTAIVRRSPAMTERITA